MLPRDIVAPDPVKRALDYALSKVGVCEDPPGSNRGADIDAWCKEFGSPLGSFWCALFVGHVRKHAGLWIPDRSVGSCDEWVYQARRAGKWTTHPVPGAAVIYATTKTHDSGRYAGLRDAQHIGLVLRTSPSRMAIEGNTSLDGYSRNGEIVTLKPIAAPRVYGYVLP